MNSVENEFNLLLDVLRARFTELCENPCDVTYDNACQSHDDISQLIDALAPDDSQ